MKGALFILSSGESMNGDLCSCVCSVRVIVGLGFVLLSSTGKVEDKEIYTEVKAQLRK